MPTLLLAIVVGLLALSDRREISAAEVTALKLETQAFKGDWEAILARGTIRVAVPYSRTLFFNDRGTQMGLTADALYEFQRWLNRKYSLSHRPITVLPIAYNSRSTISEAAERATPKSLRLISPLRRRVGLKVDFSDSIRSNVAEIVVIRKSAPPLTHIDQLAGREVHVRKTSSYYDSLVGLNKRFRKEGKSPIKITFVSDALEDEDMMEMVSSGLLQIIVVDDWKAELWAKILPTIQPLPGIVLRSGAQTGWAMRKNTPTLRRVVNQFIAEQLQGTRTAAVRLANYQKRFKSVRNSTDTAEWKKFERTIELFKTYGEKYRFDHLMLAAQGYQESRLDQQARSRSGAIGIMQILPSTGKHLGVGDITKAEPNIHGGTKYMRQLFDQHFRDADFDEQNRALFAFASYNAGPGRIAKIRAEAKHRGLERETSGSTTSKSSLPSGWVRKPSSTFAISTNIIRRTACSSTRWLLRVWQSGALPQVSPRRDDELVDPGRAASAAN
jgi:membrane-bound lytic murein transglycosylase MltF